jgi:hypothetical protein
LVHELCIYINKLNSVINYPLHIVNSVSIPVQALEPLNNLGFPLRDPSKTIHADLTVNLTVKIRCDAARENVPSCGFATRR